MINPVEKVEQKKEDKIFPDPEKSPESYRVLNECYVRHVKTTGGSPDASIHIPPIGFNELTTEDYREFAKKEGISLDVDDFLEVQKYFRDVERRNPTYTELKLIETYWSDHCRHTTFHTSIQYVILA